MANYRLLFLGEINDSFQLDTVRHKFKNYFKLTEIQTRYIFSGKEVVLKKNLSQQSALQYAMKIDAMGGITYIEAMPVDIFLPEKIEYDRRTGERRLRMVRRHQVRAGLSMDRRIYRERRN